jgi:hypothetical protein
MDRRYRDVQRVAETFIASNEIEDFAWDGGSKHPQLKIKVRGQWFPIILSSTRHEGSAAFLVKKNINQIIRGRKCT